MSRTITRADLAEAVYGASALSRREASDLVDATLAAMSRALVAGETVKISNFASFAVRQKPERTGRNPKRPDEEHIITARKIVAFSPSGELRAAVEKGNRK